MQELQQFTRTGAPDKNKVQRTKTEGEKRFDWWIYGGIGWVVNATISAAVAFSLYHTPLKNAFRSGIVEPLVKMKPLGMGRKMIEDGIFGITLCSGGTLLVPVMKYFEDRKSDIVCEWDKKIYGRKAETDPTIVNAHRDMDNAPKQSWFSMIGARVAVIGIAGYMGKTIGAHDSWLGNFSDKHLGLVKGVSTFERIGASTTRSIFHVSNWLTHDIMKLRTKPLMDSALAKTSPVKILPNESKVLHAGEIIGYELTQSSTIALIFYALSKAISTVFHRPEASPRHIPTSVTFDAGAHRKKTSSADEQATPETPVKNVTEVAHEARVSQSRAKSEPTVAA